MKMPRKITIAGVEHTKEGAKTKAKKIRRKLAAGQTISAEAQAFLDGWDEHVSRWRADNIAEVRAQRAAQAAVDMTQPKPDPEVPAAPAVGVGIPQASPPETVGAATSPEETAPPPLGAAAEQLGEPEKPAAAAPPPRAQEPPPKAEPTPDGPPPLGTVGQKPPFDVDAIAGMLAGAGLSMSTEIANRGFFSFGKDFWEGLFKPAVANRLRDALPADFSSESAEYVIIGGGIGVTGIQAWRSGLLGKRKPAAPAPVPVAPQPAPEPPKPEQRPNGAAERETGPATALDVLGDTVRE